MIIRAASLRVLPELSIFFEAVDRPGIGIPVVEVPDFLCHTRDGECCSSCWLIEDHVLLGCIDYVTP